MRLNLANSVGDKRRPNKTENKSHFNITKDSNPNHTNERFFRIRPVMLTATASKVMTVGVMCIPA